MNRRAKSGLTLIELLTVIAIVAVLAAMIMPVCVSAKQTASRAVCQSNLSEIGKAFEQYISDYGGCYPNADDPYLWTGRHWRWPMNKLHLSGVSMTPPTPRAWTRSRSGTITILACPSDPTPVEEYDKTSYGYSAAFYHTVDQINRPSLMAYYTPGPDCATVDSSMVVFPSKKAMVAEWLSVHSDQSVTWWSWDGSRNFLFADGHVKYLPDRSIHAAVDNFPDINLTANGVAGKDVD